MSLTWRRLPGWRRGKDLAASDILSSLTIDQEEVADNLA
jgi:hypothetical protein